MEETMNILEEETCHICHYEKAQHNSLCPLYIKNSDAFTYREDQ